MTMTTTKRTTVTARDLAVDDGGDAGLGAEALRDLDHVGVVRGEGAACGRGSTAVAVVPELLMMLEVEVVVPASFSSHIQPN